MITKIGLNNLYGASINFGKKHTKGAKRSEGEEKDYSRELDAQAKAHAAYNIAAQAINEDEEIKTVKKIRTLASKVVDEVNELYKDGEGIRKDGSSITIEDRGDGREVMFENSINMKTTRKSYFENGKLKEIRIPMKKQNGVPREILIKTFSDGKTLKDYEFKRGEHGSGSVDALITFTEDGEIAAYMGRTGKILSESRRYIKS